MSIEQRIRAQARTVGLRTVLKRSAEALGFDLVKRSFYSPVPDWRAMPDEVWTRRSDLGGIGWDLDAQVRMLEEDLGPYFAEFSPPVERPSGALSYHYANGFFGSVDADILYAMIRHLRPAQIVELGSGYSSLVIGAARAQNDADSGQASHHTVWDPFSRPDLAPRIREVADLRLTSANDVPLEVFDGLRAGDVLFVDTTHTVKLDSDVNFIVLDVLPRLAPGVVVHFHDIFFPFEYPKEWLTDPEVYWAEQYLLQAFLAFNPSFEVLLGAAALAADASEQVAALMPQAHIARHPGSLWMRRVP